MAADCIRVPVVEHAKLRIHEGLIVNGSLCISPLHIQFVSLRMDIDDLRILVTDVADIDSASKPGQANGDITLKLKDFRILHLKISPASLCQEVVASIVELSKLAHLKSLPCFTYQAFGYKRGYCPPLEDLRGTMVRWGCHKWKVTSVNSKYKVCPTYPSQLIVHESASDDLLLKVAKFRYLSRFPILCYYHTKTQTPLLRSSQPMMGSSQKRCLEDLQLLNACLPWGTRGTLVDTRSQSVAQLQMMKGGGGTELTENYPRWKTQFVGLDSYQQMQASLNRLVELSHNSTMSTSSSWFSKVNETGWLKNIQVLLITANSIVQTINKGNPVLVHGDTGCDIELQVTSLVQIIMDPHCRTVKGFIELIEREWLSAGHPFSLRHHHCTSAPVCESGPVFLGFLDAVYQLQHQYPTSFEFSEALLHVLFTNSYSSEYGTFVYDCQRERLANKVSDKTCSLWNHILSDAMISSLCNPFYQSNKNQLLASKTPQDMVLWTNMFVRKSVFQSQLHSPLQEKLLQLRSKMVAARQHIALLYREIESAHAALVPDQQMRRTEKDKCDFDGDVGDTHTDDLVLPSMLQRDSLRLSTNSEVDCGTAALQTREHAETVSQPLADT